MKKIAILAMLAFFDVSAVFYSQHGQDKFVAEFFNYKPNGTFIEVGSSDGITQNNTYFFEKELGWQGICIEPIPHFFELLKKNRSAICINGCLAATEGFANFVVVEGLMGGDNDQDTRVTHLSGLEGKFGSFAQNRIDSVVEAGRAEKKVIQVPCFLFNTVVAQNNMPIIDYMSIDTEGSELEILSSIDFDTVTIRLIGVENLTHLNKENSGNQIRELLVSKGYRFIKRLGGDEFYAKMGVNS